MLFSAALKQLINLNQECTKKQLAIEPQWKVSYGFSKMVHGFTDISIYGGPFLVCECQFTFSLADHQKNKENRFN